MRTLGIVIYIASLLTGAALAFRFNQKIVASKIPMQWRIDGTPSWFAPRVVGLSFIPALTFLFGTLLLVLAWTSNGPYRWFSFCAFCIACVIAQFWHLGKVLSLENRARE